MSKKLDSKPKTERKDPWGDYETHIDPITKVEISMKKASGGEKEFDLEQLNKFADEQISQQESHYYHKTDEKLPEPETEPERDEEPWECPICHKTVYIGYTVHRHCLDNLIEGFIKFIDHFEERYEGNKCGECWEYWKTIKKHYKGE